MLFLIVKKDKAIGKDCFDCKIIYQRIMTGRYHITVETFPGNEPALLPNSNRMSRRDMGTRSKPHLHIH